MSSIDPTGAERAQGRVSQPLWLIVAGLLTLSAAVIAAHLGMRGLWIDEVYTLHAISLPWREMVLERLTRGHFPLYFVFLKFWVSLWPHPSEIVLRLPSFLLWGAAVVLFSRLAQKFLSPSSAALATLLFGLNGLALRQAMEARMYTLVLLLAVLFTWAYFEVLAGEWRLWVRAVIVLVPLMGIWVSSTFLIVILVFFADSFLKKRWDILRVLTIALFLIFFTLLSPALYYTASRDRSEIAHVPPWAVLLHCATFLTGITGWEDYYSIPLSLVALQVVGGMLAVSILFGLIQRWKETSPLIQTCALVAGVPPVLMLASWAIEKSTGFRIAFHGPARYLIGCLPCSSVLTGWAIAHFVRTEKKTRVAFSALTGVLMANLFVTVRLPLETPRELIQKYFLPRYQLGDAVVVVPREAKEVVELYAPQVAITDSFPRNLPEERLAERLRAAGDGKRLWLFWIHGKGSAAVRVADQLFGRGVSSSPVRYLGERRVLLYNSQGKLDDRALSAPPSMP